MIRAPAPGIRILLGTIAIAAAFAAGLYVGPLLRSPDAARRTAGADVARNNRAMYSPQIRTDPHFLQQQQAGVEALEAHCRTTGEMCGEARQARVALERLLAER